VTEEDMSNSVVIARANLVYSVRRVVDAWRPNLPEISTIADLARALEEYDQVMAEENGARHL